MVTVVMVTVVMVRGVVVYGGGVVVVTVVMVVVIVVTYESIPLVMYHVSFVSEMCSCSVMTMAYLLVCRGWEGGKGGGGRKWETRKRRE